MENSTNTTTNTENVITDSWHDYKGDQLRLLRKKINKSRNTIFIVAGVLLLGGLVQLISDRFSTDEALFTLLIAAIFAGLGFFANIQPFGAIIVALILYVGIWILNGIGDPSQLFKGIILKAVIIYYLARGIPDANEAEKIKKELKTLP